jgi:hypothetical protein
LSLSETKGDQRDATLDDQEVDGDLTDPPVVIRTHGEVGVGGMFDPREESRTPIVGPLGEEADSLTDPTRTVWRVIGYGERHSNAYCAVRV